MDDDVLFWAPETRPFMTAGGLGADVIMEDRQRDVAPNLYGLHDLMTDRIGPGRGLGQGVRGVGGAVNLPARTAIVNAADRR